MTSGTSLPAGIPDAALRDRARGGFSVKCEGEDEAVEKCVNEAVVKTTEWNGGTWVGSVGVMCHGNPVKHAAIATVGPDGVRVHELGKKGGANNIVTGGLHPLSGDWGDYVWMRIGGRETVSMVAHQAAAVSAYMNGMSYMLSSNRYVSWVLGASSVSIQRGAQERLGFAPGLCAVARCRP